METFAMFSDKMSMPHAPSVALVANSVSIASEANQIEANTERFQVFLSTVTPKCFKKVNEEMFNALHVLSVSKYQFILD